MDELNRRDALKLTGAAVAGATTLLGSAIAAQAQDQAQAPEEAQVREALAELEREEQVPSEEGHTEISAEDIRRGQGYTDTVGGFVLNTRRSGAAAYRFSATLDYAGGLANLMQTSHYYYARLLPPLANVQIAIAKQPFAGRHSIWQKVGSGRFNLIARAVRNPAVGNLA
jgi:hypothetical protein